MAASAVQGHEVSVALACRTFSISETCYRYMRKLNDENEVIADWLVELTGAKRRGALAETTSAFTGSTVSWS